MAACWMCLPTCSHAKEYSLDELYRIALARAKRIQLSVEDLNIAKIGKDRALSYLLPRLSAFGGYTKYSAEKYNDAGTLLQPDSATSWGLRADETLTVNGIELTASVFLKTILKKVSMTSMQLVSHTFSELRLRIMKS